VARTFLHYLASLDRPHRAVVEATGGWYWIADLLGGRGVELKLAHALKLKAVAAAKVKTDPIDALTLAQPLRADLIPEAHAISPELRPYRDLLRTRLRLVQRRTSAKNSISRILEKFNVSQVGQLDTLSFAQASLEEQIELLTQQIRELERLLQPHLIPDEDVQRLLWIPGIGKRPAFEILSGYPWRAA
jgi:transposase